MNDTQHLRRTALGFASLALAAALAMPAWAQRATEPSPGLSSTPKREVAPAELLGELRKGGYILYFRHAATDFSQNDSNMKSFEDCASQRNLIDRGRADARAVGAAIKQLGIPVGAVLASPFCRTVETAQIAFGHAQKTQQVRGGPAAPADSDRYAPLRKMLITPVEKGANLAVISHGNPFHSVAGPPYLAEGEAAVIHPLGTGFEVFARIRVEDWETLKGAGKQ
jgi:phosphohistidine phosphatase SixA